MGYKLETTSLNYKDNYTAFRIRCIMLILAELTNKPNKFLTFLKFALKIIFYNP